MIFFLMVVMSLWVQGMEEKHFFRLESYASVEIFALSEYSPSHISKYYLLYFFFEMELLEVLSVLYDSCIILLVLSIFFFLKGGCCPWLILFSLISCNRILIFL